MHLPPVGGYFQGLGLGALGPQIEGRKGQEQAEEHEVAEEMVKVLHGW